MAILLSVFLITPFDVLCCPHWYMGSLHSMLGWCAAASLFVSRYSLGCQLC